MTNNQVHMLLGLVFTIMVILSFINFKLTVFKTFLCETETRQTQMCDR